jgi:hypothetical protein
VSFASDIMEKLEREMEVLETKISTLVRKIMQARYEK